LGHQQNKKDSPGARLVLSSCKQGLTVVKTEKKILINLITFFLLGIPSQGLDSLRERSSQITYRESLRNGWQFGIDNFEKLITHAMENWTILKTCQRKLKKEKHFLCCYLICATFHPN
jgi:hypothetical protein